jgi:hypothetical protein
MSDVVTIDRQRRRIARELRSLRRVVVGIVSRGPDEIETYSR